MLLFINFSIKHCPKPCNTSHRDWYYRNFTIYVFILKCIYFEYKISDIAYSLLYLRLYVEVVKEVSAEYKRVDGSENCVDPARRDEQGLTYKYGKKRVWALLGEGVQLIYEI